MVRRTEQGTLSQTSNESNLISGFISIRSGAYFSSCNRSDFETMLLQMFAVDRSKALRVFMELKCGFWPIPLSWITAESKSHF